MTNYTKKKRTNKNKTLKKKSSKYLIIEKYKHKDYLLKTDTVYYKLYSNTNVKCQGLKQKSDKNNTITANTLKMRDKIFGHPVNNDKYLEYKKKILIDKNVTKKIIKLINKNFLHTFCLHKDFLLIGQSQKIKKINPVADLLSKHTTLCMEYLRDTDNGKIHICSAGEMAIINDILYFSNDSGSYRPRLTTLYKIREAFPMLHIKIVEAGYFKKNGIKYE